MCSTTLWLQLVFRLAAAAVPNLVVALLVVHNLVVHNLVVALLVHNLVAAPVHSQLEQLAAHSPAAAQGRSQAAARSPAVAERAQLSRMQQVVPPSAAPPKEMSDLALGHILAAVASAADPVAGHTLVERNLADHILAAVHTAVVALLSAPPQEVLLANCTVLQVLEELADILVPDSPAAAARTSSVVA